MKPAFQMVDVGGKVPTRRRARASGALRMSAPALALLKAGRLPKGDALKLGEAAGIMAAKQTSLLLPLCHPIPLDQVLVSFEFGPGVVRASCEAAATAKTGVEMEALAGACGALLCVYDLVKPVDPDLTLEAVRLDYKDGGKSRLVRRKAGRLVAEAETPLKGRRAAVLTISDRAWAGKAEDRSGPLLADGLKALGAKVGARRILPDEKPLIAEAIRQAAAKFELVVLTGGTGLSKRDVSPESVEAVCERLVPGFGELLRSSSSNPAAPLSRSVTGQLGRTLVVALPGSRGAVTEGLEVLRRLLPHALEVMGGSDHGGAR